MKRSLFLFIIIAIATALCLLKWNGASSSTHRAYTYEEQVARGGNYEEVFFFDDNQKLATLKVELFGDCRSSTLAVNVGDSLKGKISSWQDVVKIAQARFTEAMPEVTNEKTEAVVLSSPRYGGEKRIIIFENKN